ncbi:unnamed protein product [Linum tenue]|uniref:Uncharacterized protein n=1 Tax=Linum tenue TaxID=586396 RepID=A0AAV0M5S5_9ROSI|nr:unnamed protein product [Linum tenue]
MDHAVILVKEDGGYMERYVESPIQSLISLFQASSNVDTLRLDSETIQILDDMSDFLEQQPSPFTRLKSLIVKADSIPYALASYFLKGSSGVKPRIEFP